MRLGQHVVERYRPFGCRLCLGHGFRGRQRAVLPGSKRVVAVCQSGIRQRIICVCFYCLLEVFNRPAYPQRSMTPVMAPFLTLPSRTLATLSLRPISRTSISLPLNENAEVRATTYRFSTFVSALIRSSARPSQKYSFSTSALMFRKGKTPIEVGVGAGSRVG